ncbi:MAG: hypothetical protein ACKVWR_00615 [Acidimicrobiales bacterium]
MTSNAMVHLASVSCFEAKVLAARLGAEGIVWQLRGNVDSVYPLGGVDVLVAAGDADRAQEMLLVDEVEAALAAAFEPETPASLPAPPPHASRWVLAAVGLALAGLTSAAVGALAWAAWRDEPSCASCPTARTGASAPEPAP